MRPRAGTSILFACAQARTAAGSGATSVCLYVLPDLDRLRPASTYGASALRSFLALAGFRSISYDLPSSPKAIVSAATEPSMSSKRVTTTFCATNIGPFVRHLYDDVPRRLGDADCPPVIGQSIG